MSIEHDEQNQRFYIKFPDGFGLLDYRAPGADIVDFYHTEVTQNLRGKGIAAALVAVGVGFARRTGKRIIPSCWFVRQWIMRHPEHQDLVLAS